jgi:hypothetical protein
MTAPPGHENAALAGGALSTNDKRMVPWYARNFKRKGGQR